MATGKLIVFEGIDGSGKSTQIALLKKALTEMGLDVWHTAEPTKSETGLAIRRALAGEEERSAADMALLFTMDRIAHNKEIDKALQEGKIVICDRYYYSSLAYQGSLCDYEWVWHMNYRCPEIRHPDLCIFLDLSPKDALERISKRGEGKEIYETEERLSMFRDAFHRVFVSLRDRVEIIDAAPAVGVIAERVLVHVKKVLAKKKNKKEVQ